MLRHHDSRRNAERRSARRYVAQDDGVRTNAGVIPNTDRTKDLRAWAHVYMSAKVRHAAFKASRADSHLLHQHAIRAYV